MQTDERGPSLLRALAEVPDPRSRHGRRQPFAAVLARATVALLCGARRRYASAQWGREQPEAVVRTRGLTRQPTRSVATLQRVFKALDVDMFERGLAQWVPAAVGGRGEASAGMALDGKALRGIHGEQVPGVGLVAAADDVPTGLVRAQKGGEAQTPSGGV